MVELCKSVSLNERIKSQGKSIIWFCLYAIQNPGTNVLLRMYCVQYKTSRERKWSACNSGFTGSVGKELLPVLSIQDDLKNNRVLCPRLRSMYLSVHSLLIYYAHNILGVSLVFNLIVADSKNPKLQILAH